MRRAVHTADVFVALANYLRSWAPLSLVLSVITQLLRSPELFSSNSPPDLSVLDGIKRCVMIKCLEEQRRPGQMILSSLQQLVDASWW